MYRFSVISPQISTFEGKPRNKDESSYLHHIGAHCALIWPPKGFLREYPAYANSLRSLPKNKTGQ